MVKKVENKDYKKRFMNGFKMLCNSKSPYTVWGDCMALFAITIANTSILPLSKEEPVLPEDINSIWFTLMWFSDVWTLRRLFHNQDILGRKINNEQNSNRH